MKINVPLEADVYLDAEGVVIDFFRSASAKDPFKTTEYSIGDMIEDLIDDSVDENGEIETADRPVVERILRDFETACEALRKALRA